MTRAEKRQLWQIQGKGSACATALAIFLRAKEPRKAVKQAKKERLVKEMGMTLARRARWNAVKAIVARRAAGICECGCGGSLLVGGGVVGGEADHFYGKKFETPEAVWQLRTACHMAKTQNHPSRELWDLKFLAHCNKYGIAFKPRLTKALGLPRAAPLNQTT